MRERERITAATDTAGIVLVASPYSAERGVMIHAVLPGNQELVAKKLGIEVGKYPELIVGTMTVAAAAKQERIHLDLTGFKFR